MSRTILVALNDSASSKYVIESLIDLDICSGDTHVKLAHILIRPSAGDELMGKRFMKEQPVRLQSAMEQARDALVDCGIPQKNIEIEIVSEPCDTVADGIIALFQKAHYDMVVIGRKKMSKAQEFVMGDPSIRLVRMLEETMILVVKSA